MAKAGFSQIVCNHRAEAPVQKILHKSYFNHRAEAAVQKNYFIFFVFISCFAPCFSLAIHQFS